MKQHFTQDHLIQFIYQELSASEMLAVEEALDSDPVLQQEYEELLEAYRLLPQVTFQPSVSTTAKILAYSRETSLETQY